MGKKHPKQGSFQEKKKRSRKKRVRDIRDVHVIKEQKNRQTSNAVAELVLGKKPVEDK